jgi:hypothetical protein
VFGGYTSRSWKSSKEGSWEEDKNSFIVSITYQTMHPIKKNAKNAIFNDSEYMTVFGMDFWIADGCNEKVNEAN